MKKLLAAVAALLLGLLQFGCSKDDDKGSTPRITSEFRGEVYNSSYSTLFDNITNCYGAYNATGKLSGNTITLNLSAPVVNNLVTVNTFFAEMGAVSYNISSSNNSARLFDEVLSFFCANKGSTFVDDIWYMKYTGDEVVIATFIYANADVAVTGNVLTSLDGFSLTINLSLKEGWNIAYLTNTSNSTTGAWTTWPHSGLTWLLDSDFPSNSSLTKNQHTKSINRVLDVLQAVGVKHN